MDSRTVRVFLSSTFRDFSEERDLLVRKVFPELRRKCRERQVELVDVDLRWGITEKEAQQGKVLPICLAEIDRSRPYFMGFIGERYGWVPEKHQYDLSLILEQPWLDEHRGGKSVTELEMLHGVLNNSKMAGRAFFYFRSPAYSRKKGGPYLSEGTEEKAKLEALKDRIRKSRFPVVENYRSPEKLAEKVRDDLWKLIDESFPENEVPDALARERMRHEAYSATRRGLYLGGERYFETLDTAMRVKPFRPVLINGQSGGGKSALLANWAAEWRKRHPKALVIVHHLGCGADAADPVRMATRLMEEIARSTGDEFKPESDPDKQLEQLPQWLAIASVWAKRERKEFLFVLDGLDKINDRGHLRWFPNYLPPRVKLVASCLQGEVFEAAKILLAWSDLRVRPLTKSEQKYFIGKYLGRYRKSLTAKQTSNLQCHPLSGNPLFLLTILEELRVFGVHEKLADRLLALLTPPSGKARGEEPMVDDIFEHVLSRIEEDFGRKSVQAAMEAIWASRSGLLQDELLGIAKLAPSQWAAIQNALDESIYESGGKINFGHDHLRKAVEDRYRISGKRKLNLHHRLAGWFSKREVDVRVAEELPWQWMQAANGRELRASLLDSRLFKQLVSKDKYELLQYWLSLKTTSIAAEYEKVWESWCGETWNALEGAAIAELLGEFLARAGYYGTFTNKLFRSSVSYKSKFFGAKHCVALKALLGLADLLKDAGKLEEAESKYTEVLDSATDEGQNTKMLFLEAQNNLGLLMAERGNHQKAEKLLKACLRGHSDALGDQHPRTLATLNNIGVLAESRGDFPEAREYYRRAQAGLSASRGDGHPMSLMALGNVASMSDVIGDTIEARVLYTQTHKAFTEVLGAEHPFTLNTVNNLACLEFVSGDPEVAGQLFAGVVSAYRRTLDKNHPLLLKALDNLGHVRFRAGDLARAIRHFKEAFEGRKRTLGSGHNDTEASRYNFALSLKKSGKVSRAKKVLLEDGDPSDPNHNYLLARCECQRAHRDDAVRYLKLALSAKPELLPKALEEQDFNSIRASVLLEQKRSENNGLGASKCRPK